MSKLYISEHTVSRIHKEKENYLETSLNISGKHNPCPLERNVACDSFDRHIVREVIQNFYLIEKKLLLAVLEKINFSWGL